MDQDKKKIGSLKFDVFENGDVSITCDIENNSVEGAKLYGEMLFAINKSAYAQQISNKLKKTNPDFATIAISTWAEFIKTLKDIPLVRPSNVFRGME